MRCMSGAPMVHCEFTTTPRVLRVCFGIFKMEAIFHEKQEGSLCAQHCLNTLLQGPYFTPVDLASFAQSLDDEERLRMAEGDVNSEEYQTFLQQPSSNYDDSGFFSIQVMCRALSVWNLELVPFSHPRVQDARDNPQNQTAFICNFQQHWFTIRKLGNQWFNINSLKTEPELISETYLSLFLTQVQAEGYSIFVVVGDLPQCEADQLLRLCPAKPVKKPASKPAKFGAIQKSDLQAALHQVQSSSESKPVNVDEVRRKREQYFNSQQSTSSTELTDSTTAKISDDVKANNNTDEMTEDEMLQAALLMSLSGNPS